MQKGSLLRDDMDDIGVPCKRDHRGMIWMTLGYRAYGITEG